MDSAGNKLPALRTEVAVNAGCTVTSTFGITRGTKYRTSSTLSVSDATATQWSVQVETRLLRPSNRLSWMLGEHSFAFGVAWRDTGYGNC